MKITTKSGDEGWTSLRFNRPIRKDDPRLDAMGAVDELSSLIGMAKCSMRSPRTKEALESCQKGLCLICAELATLPEDLERLEKRLGAKDVQALESVLKKYEDAVEERIDCFVLPGACRASAQLDLCRSVCRRTERLAAALYFAGGATNQRIIEYLNRMSDLFYLMARSMEKKRAAAD